MPNWVVNKIEFSGTQENINKVLDIIKGDENIIDFNKLIPMPKSLKLTSGSITNTAIVYALNRKGDEERNKIIKQLKNTRCSFYGNYYNTIKDIDDERVKRGLEHFNSDSKSLYDKAIYEELGIKTFEDLGNAYISNILELGYDTWYDWCCAKWGTKWGASESYMETENTLMFSTAWSAPFPIFKKLAEICHEYNVEFAGKWADEDTGCNTGVFECHDGEFWYDYMENQSNDAYEIYVELWGESNCIGQDEDGNWTHYDCDDCPNADCC